MTPPDDPEVTAPLAPDEVFRPVSSSAERVVVYKANDSSSNSLVTLYQAVINCYQMRALLRTLIARDLVALHKKSFLGLAWTVITPALSIMSFVLLRLTGVLRAASGLSNAGFVVYVLAGTTVYNIQRAASNQVRGSLVANNSLLLQIKFPRELMLVKHLALSLITSGISIVITMIFALPFGVRPTWNWLLFPFSLVPVVLIGFSVGIVMALAAVVALDIDRLVEIGWGFLFVAVPVIYRRSDMEPPFSDLLFWNPFTHLVEYPRHLMIGDEIGGPYDLSGYLLVSLGSVLVFLAAWHMFSRSQARLMERLV